jgi:hypothetical protein
VALKLEILLEAIDRISGPMRRAAGAVAALGRSAQMERLGAAMGRVANAAGQVATRLAAFGAGGALAAGAGIALAGRSALRGAAQMERFAITLEVVEGSAEAAERALAWVNDFATRTPFELAEVTKAFVDIRNLGLDPTRGALQAAGDAASIMGTRFDEAVVAMSAALRGEMDPLERFGVFARTEGENIVLNWDAHGRQMRAVVDKNNRAMLAQMIQTAWEQKFGGGMDRLSRSWDGMMSNLADAWARFQQMIMNSGVFDWLKDRLDRLLQQLGRMAADGTLQQWADRIAAAVIRLFEAIERLVTDGDLFGRVGSGFARLVETFDRVHAALSPIVGPFDALDAALVSLAAITLAPFITALAGLALALAALGANPMAMAAIAALTALGLAGKAIYDNWAGIADWFGRQMKAIEDAIKGPADALERLLGLQRQLPGGGGGSAGPRIQPNGGGRILRQGARIEDLPELMDVPATPAGAGTERVDLGGTLRIRIEDGRVTTAGRMNDPRARLDINQGVVVGTI